MTSTRFEPEENIVKGVSRLAQEARLDKVAAE